MPHDAATDSPPSRHPASTIRACCRFGTLPGVGPALAETLQKLGLERVQDLWFHLPLRYEDRTEVTPIRDVRIGESAQVIGVVEAVERGFRYRPQLRVAIGDDSRATLILRFFHFNRSQADQLAPGVRLVCYGEVRHGAHGPEMVHPQYTRIAADATAAVDDRLTPVYPTTEGLGQKRLAGVIARALERLPDDAKLELIPPALRESLVLGSLREALLTVHGPPAGSDVGAFALRAHPAQQRLAFEELPDPQPQPEAPARAAAPSSRAAAQGRRPAAQGAARKAAVRADESAAARRQGSRKRLAKAAPMLRLVQGDVGSGKTVVAALAALAAIEAGPPGRADGADRNPRRAALAHVFGMARAARHRAGLARRQRRERRARRSARGGRDGAPIAIGTHALMQEGVAFTALGLVIIDEQHRFGVHQRLTLRDKGAADGAVPHQLVLTATPIPRTLAMTAYADLDISVIDELPPGRTPVADGRDLRRAARRSRRAHPRRVQRRPPGVLGVHADRGVRRSSKRRRPKSRTPS